MDVCGKTAGHGTHEDDCEGERAKTGVFEAT